MPEQIARKWREHYDIGVVESISKNQAEVHFLPVGRTSREFLEVHGRAGESLEDVVKRTATGLVAHLKRDGEIEVDYLPKAGLTGQYAALIFRRKK